MNINYTALISKAERKKKINEKIQEYKNLMAEKKCVKEIKRFIKKAVEKGNTEIRFYFSQVSEKNFLLEEAANILNKYYPNHWTYEANTVCYGGINFIFTISLYELEPPVILERYNSLYV